MVEPDRSMIYWVVGPMIAVAFGFIGLFWQISAQGTYFASNFLSLREHAEFQASARREVDGIKKDIDQRFQGHQHELGAEIKDLQNQIDNLRQKR